MNRPRLAVTTAGFVSCALALAACGDNKTASKDNFKTALDKHFQNHCIFITPSVGVTAFPVTVEDNSDKARYNALVSAGLLTESSKTIEHPGPLNIGTVKTEQDTYDLTSSGKSTFQHGQGASDTGFCAGHYTVGEVTSFTPPASQNGQTVSEAQYTLQPTMASWVSTTAVQDRYGSELAQAKATSDHSTMVLGNDGWKVAGDQ